MQELIFQNNKKFYQNIGLAIICELFVFGVIIVFASWLNKRPVIEILFDCWILVFLIPFALFFILLTKWGSKSSRSNKSIAKLENEFKKNLKDCIKIKLGKHASINLNPDLNQMDFGQSEVICKLIKTEAKNDVELKYYLYSLMGIYEVRNEKYSKAINNFISAISLNNDCTMCKTLLAETYELINDSSKAIETYESILFDYIDDECLSIYYKDQIRIVKEKGPRKYPLMTGLRYLSY